MTVEGIEGVGKTTAVSAISQLLEDRGLPFVCTREPGGTAVGEAIRQVLLDPGSTLLSADTEALLMFAARAQHVDEVIKPALAEGRWVICDRFVDASYAYQAGGRGLSMSRTQVLHEWVLGDLMPDLTLLLDAPMVVCAERLARRGGEKDRIEQEQDAFFIRVQQAYLDRAVQDPKRIQRIDTDADPKHVVQRIREAVSRHFAWDPSHVE